MKKICTILLACTTIYCTAQDQETIGTKASTEQMENKTDKPQKKVRSAFRRGYIRLGFNSFGNNLDNAQSAPANLSAGNFGAKQGYVFEFGHVFYFNRNGKFPLKFGLDWTILSLTYNELDWTSYIATKGDSKGYTDGATLAVSAISKLGLVISINPVEKLVIDVRAQVAPGVYAYGMNYYTHQNQANENSFAFGTDNDKVTDRLRFAVKPSFGITIRRKAIGFALDYSPGKVKYPFTTVIGAKTTTGDGEFKTDNLQLKLNFTL